MRSKVEEGLKERKRFARDLAMACERMNIHDTRISIINLIAARLGCVSSFGPRTWLEGEALPGKMYGQKVLDMFGLDSRDYGGNWNQGRR